MELTIDFECPACRKVLPRPVADIALGSRKPCAGCGTETELTEHGLIEFRRRLQRVCVPSVPPGEGVQTEQG